MNEITSFFSDSIRVRYLHPELPQESVDGGLLVWLRRVKRARIAEAQAIDPVALFRHSQPENHGISQRHFDKVAEARSSEKEHVPTLNFP